MKRTNKTLLLLALLFAVLMSLPYLVPHLGFLALIGFVPLLFMDVVADAAKVKHFFWWHYLAFVLWNAMTTFWVCNATLLGGIAAILANALQMSVIFAIYRRSQKTLGNSLSLVFLAVMWVAWERFYFNAEISWPWLTLGNAFAGSIDSVQWYEFTGSLGGSVWIWIANIWIFYTLTAFASGHVFKMKRYGVAIMLVVLAAVVAGPFIWSGHVLRNYSEDRSRSLDVLVVQPDFDPYQKFQHLTQSQQTSIFLEMVDKAVASRDFCEEHPLLIMTPETFTNDVVMGKYQDGYTWNRFQSFLSDKPGVNILFGASAISISQGDKAPSPQAIRLHDGSWLRMHNAAFITDVTGRTDAFLKSKLVIGTEYIPFPKILCKVDDLLGRVMGRCDGQKEISLLNFQTYDTLGFVKRRIPIGCAVCYESVFGDYCRGYENKGAEAMTIITNDAWWGDTPGYRQHLRYACLRAVELRRDIARCANTGISAFIDQRGHIVDRSTWWTREVLEGKVYLSDRQTFFARNGDVPGRICTFCFLLLLAFMLVKFIVRR